MVPLNLTLSPGDVCVYYQETTSAVPAFSVQAYNQSTVQAFSAGYDNLDLGYSDGYFMLPSNFAVLNQSQAGLAYYNVQPLSLYINGGNDTLSCALNYSYYQCQTRSGVTTYYSPYNLWSPTFYLKSMNPFYNFYYTLSSKDGLSYSVVFTDGNTVITPKPNMTSTTYADGSLLYTDQWGNRALYPANLLYPAGDFDADT